MLGPATGSQNLDSSPPKDSKSSLLVLDFFHTTGLSALLFLFPQQRKLTGSSAQISSGVCRCGSERQVPDEGSGGRFRRVPACAGVGSGGRFRRVPVCAGVGSGRRFRKVPEGSGVCWCRFRRQVPESSGVCWCRFRRQVPEGSGGFQCVLV